MRSLSANAPIIAHADGSDEAKRARAARFRAEAKKPPPPLPQKRIAWAGGKIATNSKDECLRRLLQRKMANGEKLTPEQLQAAAALQPASAADVNVNVGQLTMRTVVVKTDPPRQPQPSQQQQKQQSTKSTKSTPPVQQSQPVQPAQPEAPAICPEKRKLLKKLREIELLESKLTAGVALEANQEAKVQSKAELVAKLAQLA